MADDNTLRSYQSNDPYRRTAQARHDVPSASDPLAELARLIGQPDPFSDDGRGASRGDPLAPPPRTAHHELASDDWRRHVQRPNFDVADEAVYAQHDTQHEGAYDDRDYSRAGAIGRDTYRAAAPEPGYDDAEPRAGDWGEPSAAYPAEAMREPRWHDSEQARRRAVQTDEDYDDPPRRARSNGLVTALVLIGCAVLGTAGAYGYRTYSASASRQAPVIIADTAPSKIVPSTETKAPRTQDRIAQGGSDERLVSREEQPVTLPGTQQVPRVVFPPLVQPNQTGAPATTGTTPAASNAQAPVGQPAATEPKRVRTVTIRPEGEAPPAARAQPTTRSTAPAPPPRASRDQPLVLDPAAAPAPGDSRSAPQPRPLTPPAPRDTAASGPRVASAPPSGGVSGGYLVQVSSQRSEADAQNSYRTLQAKYAPLRARQPIIRRADLGAKGVYYRAMVGPFESPSEADQFCGSLKQAGGQCIIVRN
ncbi:MAG: SPOR domain-containing protein [Hyphomicrobiales bacterium]|nr:SPOR domain-containing protein [Hyphomicrobiales bacterium]